MISSFENMTVSEKVDYLLRKYDLFIQEYVKVTPNTDELTFWECFGGKQLENYFPDGGVLTFRFWWEWAREGGDFFRRFQTLHFKYQSNQNVLNVMFVFWLLSTLKSRAL